MPRQSNGHRRHIGQLGCWRRRRRISAWFDLTKPQREAIQREAHRCAACSDELEHMLNLQRQLSTTRQTYQTLQYPHAAPPPHVRAAWAQRVHHRPRATWGLVPAGLAATFAAVVFVLLVSQYLPSSLTPPTVTRSVRHRALPPRPPSPQPVAVSTTLQAMRHRIRQGGDIIRPQKPPGLALRMPKRPRRQKDKTSDRSTGKTERHKAISA